MNSKTTLKQILIYLVVICVIISIPILSIITVVYSIPDPYEEDYARVLSVQFEYLKETKDEDRIIIVGTSSAAFGINGDTIAQQFNKKVVIFGLYGAIGNTCMLDWVDPYIHEGDIVIWMYDIYKEALKEHYDPEIALRAIYKNIEMFNLLSEDRKKQTISYLPTYINNAIQLKLKNISGGPIDAYHIDSFNEKGYMTYERDGWLKDAPAIESEDFVTVDMISSDFTDKVALWAQKQRDKKARVFMHYCPIAEKTKNVNVTNSEIDAFTSVWEQMVDMTPLNKLKNCYLSNDLFYDGPYHLTSKGARYFTSVFIRNLETGLYGGSSYPLESIK